MLLRSTQPKGLTADFIHKRADFVRNHYAVLVPASFSLDDLMQPEAWMHATKLQRFDLVEVIAIDGSFDAELRVESVGNGFVQMRLLREWRPAVAAESEIAATGARVGFNPISRWRVFGHSGEELARGFLSKSDALAALDVYLSEVPEPEMAVS